MLNGVTLAELVKIEPKSIGVGLYQHDVTPKKLDETLFYLRFTHNDLCNFCSRIV